MTRKERYTFILDYFRTNVGEVSTELMFGSAFQLLCATLLSAQCTDKRINAITPALFAKFPDAKTMAKADVDDVFELVKSVSYPNSKANHLVEMARMLVNNYGGEIPSDPNELVKLPGVGRKTANVLQAVWFGKPTLAVDTHVYRVSHRLGLVPNEANTPRKVEDYLMKNIPLNEVSSAHHWILLHGRYICKSMRPLCEKCPFDTFCPKNLENSKLSNK
ncbi:endonuclease III [Prevotella disiens JCM 6334 = ATCC 29426]|jgi:endonuclease-3|uniref:Endonuclease III n=3 Tax=Prevotella disiens TaxID=28130 RepID=A0A096CXQ9_9BACT|nr:endonuclease III [Prevotella disiens]ERJ76908.1 endonuclease III [Prevotella disiens JCM 6334 = ATCC 29426]KGF50104.1 endonuclease III [Prevotella disiens DNF00882]SUB97796.1 Endonuclease III [Prevotella disiens]